MPILEFPGGQAVDVQFDPIGHSYVVAHRLADGQMTGYRPTHGATTPLEVVPKPFLTPWGSKSGVEATVEYFYAHPETVENLPKFYEDKEAMENNYRNEDGKPVCSYYRFKKLYPWFLAAKTAYKEKSKEGKELGTWIHVSIENYLNSGRKTLPVITPEVKGMWDSFIMFDNFYKPKVEELEFLVYSLMFGYSGQGDFKGWMNGKHCIGDWKSTNRSEGNPDGISIEYFFQVGGLAQAEFERTGVWVEDLFIANFDKEGGEPRVIWASEFGASPQDCARAYVSCFNTYHTIKSWDYKWSKR